MQDACESGVRPGACHDNWNDIARAVSELSKSQGIPESDEV